MRLRETEVVARVRRVRRAELRDWVRRGWVRPARGAEGEVFDELDVARVRLICDLRREMALPVDAVPPVLDLLDQVHGLRRELRALAEALDALPDAHRGAVREALRRRRGD